MKTIFTILISLLIATVSNSQRTVEETMPVTKGNEVSLDFQFADEIIVSSWDKNEVYVKATVSINGNENNDKFKFSTSQKSGGIKIKSTIEDIEKLRKKGITVRIDEDGRTISNCSMDLDLYFEVKMPADCKLSIETISGDIEIKGIEEKMFIETISGFIDLSIPEKIDADLEMSTVSGAMYTDFNLKKDKNGYYHYHRNEIEVQLNNGGKRIYLETVSGDIFLRKAK